MNRKAGSEEMESAGEKLTKLIDLSYEAALEPGKWPEFLKQVIQSTNARSALIRHVDYRSAHVGFCEAIGYDPVYTAAYRNHYVRLDPYAATWTHCAQGVLVSSESVVKLADRRKTEYHNDYERPQGIQEGLGCILAKNENYDLQFAVQRGLKARNFRDDAESLWLLSSLMPHLARAMHIRRALAHATQQQTWTLEALHQLQMGLILADHRGHPFFFNRAAEQLMASCPGVSFSQEGLRLIRSSDVEQLKRLIADAARILRGESARVHGGLRVGLLNGETLQIQVVPLMPEQTRWGGSMPAGSLALFVSKPGQPSLPWQKLVALYGLTPAEAKLAAKLADGLSLAEVVEEFSISISTARTQLRAIFNKTGVRRQSELVALLLTSVLSCQASVQ